MGELGREVKTSYCKRVGDVSHISKPCTYFCFSKAIDYIQELNATKEDLLRRLAQARGALPPDHPLLCPRGIPNLATGQNVPLWEREWNYSPDADDEGSEDETN